jgi:AraC-like DNA-binding protein
MDPRVELITRVIAEQKTASRLSAREAGSLLGICEGHFLRLFKREVGTTFRRYKREARITGVAGLLTDSAAAVKQIASAAGYDDVSNFHRDFKQVRGMSPRQWKLMELRTRPHLLSASD